jgi:hypothetical protein
MTIARWKISVQPLTETADSTPFGPARLSPLERAARYMARQRSYEQQRDDVARWMQLNGGR